MEDIAYRRLLDQYYLREGALPADIQAAAKLVRMRSMAADVESVLREFFVLTEAGWTHARCDQEIAKMQDKQAKAKAAAELSVKSRRAAAERRLEEEQTGVERALASIQTDVKLPTPTPTPTPKEAKASSAPNAKQVRFDASAGTFDVPAAMQRQWAGAFPAVVVETELAKAAAWLVANPKNQKSNYARFLVAWLTRAQDKAPAIRDASVPIKPGTSEYARLHKDAAWWREAGFSDVWDANSSMCWEHNAHQFHAGKRVEVAA